MRRASLYLLFACSLGAAVPSWAVTTCNGSNVSMSLGAYNGFQATDLDSSGLFIVTCTRNGGPPTTTVTVGIGPSTVSGSIATRRLRLVAGTDVLSYNLFRDAGRSLVWGDTIGTNTLSQNITLGNNSSGALNFTIFGRINALQDVRAGTYTDTLTMTVTF
jgi:spore coat protein U domain-containing protein, fimbrial subunit CupE1/2/3/6